MPLFHLKQMVVRGTTLKPKTIPGQVLLNISKTLIYTDKYTFTQRLRSFYIKYHNFIEEKTINPDGSWWWTHEGVKKAYESLANWYAYIFTFHKDRDIPTTTNTCDGHFSHIKDVMRIHRGLKKDFKQKVLDSIFLESTIAPKKK